MRQTAVSGLYFSRNAVREVEELCGGVDEGEAEGDEGVGTARDNAVYEELVEHFILLNNLIQFFYR